MAIRLPHQTALSDPPYLIAEIGNNHGGVFAVARQLVEQAAKAGWDAVKFQRRTNDAIYTRAYLDSPYTGPNSYGPTYGEHRAALELSLSALVELREYAHSLGLAFGCTAFDQQAANELAAIGTDFIKVASADCSNIPLLAHIAKMGLPMVVSTGCADEGAVYLARETVHRWYAIGDDETIHCAWLQCTARYPCWDSELDIAVLRTYRDWFWPFGLSYHGTKTMPILLAYAMHGRVFELHVTDDRARRGTDNQFSWTLPMMTRLRNRLKESRRMLGFSEKIERPEEAAAYAKMGKVLCARRSIVAGQKLEPDDTVALIAGPAGANGTRPNRLPDWWPVAPRDYAVEEVL